MTKFLILIILFFAPFVHAEGPLFKHKEPEKQQEFENVYKDIRSKHISTNLLNVTCIDSPTFCVDETNNRVGIGTTTPQAPLTVGTVYDSNGTNATILAARAYTGSGNGHTYEDISTWAGDNGTSAASYDSRFTTIGSNNFGHIIGYQTALFHTSAGTIDHIYGFGAFATNNGGADGDSYGFYAGNGAGTGIMGVQYGFYAESLTKGTTNYAIYTAGTTPSVLGGPVSQPGQPSFLAYNSANDLNVTGDGTVVTIEFDTEVFDQASNFASNTFTAPITGRYQLNATVEIQGTLAGHTAAYMTIVTSNRTYIKVFDPIGAKSEYSFSLSVLADMDINDTAIIQVSVSGATKVVDITGTGSAMYTSFSGSLIN